MRVGRPFGLLPGILNSQLVHYVPEQPAGLSRISSLTFVP